MTRERKVLRVAAVQAAPEFLDKDRCVDKAVGLVHDAAARGARLVAFGETWIPGYPAWVDSFPGVAQWDHAHVKSAYAALRDNSVTVPGPEIDRLAAAARERAVVLVIGVNERVLAGPGHGTIYNALLTIGSDGAIASHHRKLVPTHAERLIWGAGAGEGLSAVDTSAGRVGGLICWEHWMPMARQVMHDSCEQVHVAAWPTVREMYQVASRHYAFEGRCFVLAVGSLVRASDLPHELAPSGGGAPAPDELVVRGGSCIIAPDGSFLVDPSFDAETILMADLDLGRIAEESMALDVTGHYSRPDLFELRRKG